MAHSELKNGNNLTKAAAEVILVPPVAPATIRGIPLASTRMEGQIEL